MKKPVAIILIAIAFVTCKKDQTAMTTTQTSKMTGKSNIVTVTVIPSDSTGKAINNGNIITEPSYYYFQFNVDNTWVESLTPDPNADLGESGSYILHADTSFTLINVNAPSKAAECRIATLTDTTFEFHFQRTTLFNGVTPGYLEYIFNLKK